MGDKNHNTRHANDDHSLPLTAVCYKIFILLVASQLSFAATPVVFHPRNLSVNKEILLSPPSNLRVLTIGSDMVTIGWDDPNIEAAIQGYRLFYTAKPELPLVLWIMEEYPGNQQSATVVGLISNQTYTFTVLVYTSTGLGPLSPPLEVEIRLSAPRSPPTNLRILRFGRGWVTLEWDKPDVKYILKGYKVYYTTRPERPFSVWNIELITGQTETLTINDLVSKATYTFRVAAFNEGGEGPLSLALRTKMKQVKRDKPRRVSVHAINSTSIYVDWRPPKVFYGVDGYNVYYEEFSKDKEHVTGIRHKAATEKNDMIITGLKPDTAYRIQVAGYTHLSGEGMISDPKTQRTAGSVPSKPRNISVSLIDSDLPVARVSWQPPQYSYGPLTSYKIYMGNRMEPFQTVLVDNDTLSYVTPHLDSGITYRIDVQAGNEYGYGESAVSELRTPENSHPTVLINPQYPVASAGENVSLQCVAKGNPSPAISWKIENQDQVMLPNGDYGRFSVTEDGSLFIQDVKGSDAGVYVCDAFNFKGKSSASSILEVIDANAREEKMSPFQEKILKLIQRNVDANEKIAEEMVKTNEAVEKMVKSIDVR